MKTKNIRIIIGVFLAGLGLTSCSDYEGSKLEVMEPSTVTFQKATGAIQDCSFSGGIADVVDCYLTLTDFDGQVTTVKLNDQAYSSDLFQTTGTSGQFLTKISLKLNDNFYALLEQDKLPTKYDYSFKPGKLTGECFIHKASGVDSTYTFTCANAEMAGTLEGDEVDGKAGPLTEAKIKAWMKSVYDSGVKATFTYLINEMGWPMCYAKKDDIVEYDF